MSEEQWYIVNSQVKSKSNGPFSAMSLCQLIKDVSTEYNLHSMVWHDKIAPNWIKIIDVPLLMSYLMPIARSIRATTAIGCDCIQVCKNMICPQTLTSRSINILCMGYLRTYSPIRFKNNNFIDIASILTQMIGISLNIQFCADIQFKYNSIQIMIKPQVYIVHFTTS